jgi:signal transduction histidine kinase
MTELGPSQQISDPSAERFLIQQVRQALAIALSSLDRAKGLLEGQDARRGAGRPLGDVERELDRCAFVLERLRRFVQRRAVPGKVHRSSVDIRVLLEGAALATAPGRHKHLKVHLGGVTEGTVQGDEVLLFEAFASLLSTAADATAGAAGCVRVECTTTAQGVVVTIRDDSPGAVGEELERFLGERGRPASSSRGLTLAFVRDVIDAHGARLEVASDEAGSAVMITFPSSLPATSNRR